MLSMIQNVKYPWEKMPAGNASSGHNTKITIDSEMAQIHVILYAYAICPGSSFSSSITCKTSHNLSECHRASMLALWCNHAASELTSRQWGQQINTERCAVSVMACQHVVTLLIEDVSCSM